MQTLVAALLMSLAFATANAWAQATVRPPCNGACGVIESIVPVTERQTWTPLGSVTPGSMGAAGLSSMAGSSTQMVIGPGFTNQGMVVLGSAGGAIYAQRPNEYRRQRWDVTLKMDSGPVRVVSLGFEPLFLQVGDYVRVSGNNLELVTP